MTETQAQPESLMTTVRRELALRKGHWRQVVKESGVPYDTLCKIAQGRVDPGVSRVQRLLDYFRQHPFDKATAPRRTSNSAATSA